jgi:hypothetical protein
MNLSDRAVTVGSIDDGRGIDGHRPSHRRLG